ncbi:MAG: PhoH family protein, partial [Chromatiales bacterium]|nr:PhoH family protein [Chromatiales bacterium]
MTNNDIGGARLFVVDTNVLMHDPTALFRFQEHDVYLPMIVLEELDAGKKGVSEVARNARQVSRFLDELMHDASREEIERGLPVVTPLHNGDIPSGRLFLQTRQLPVSLPESMPGNIPDNNILGTALALQESHPEQTVTLVSKDINLRIKAAVLGVHAEDYYNDQVLDDVNLLYIGATTLPADFWEKHSRELESWQEEGRSYYRVHGEDVRSWYANQGLTIESDESLDALVRKVDGDSAVIETAKDYRNQRNAVWGITARNREQNFALNLLMDPEVDFVTMMGTAGTGKTLLALAAGLQQTLEQNRFREIIMT